MRSSNARFQICKCTVCARVRYRTSVYTRASVINAVHVCALTRERTRVLMCIYLHLHTQKAALNGMTMQLLLLIESV